MKEFAKRLRFYLRLGFATGLLVLRTRRLRRRLMFYVSVAAMLAVFAGGVLLPEFLVEHPWLFVGYWFVSVTLGMSMILLALYDMLRVKADQAQGERAELMELLAEIERVAAAEAEEREREREREGEGGGSQGC